MARDRGLQSVYFVQTLGPGRAPRLLYQRHSRRQAPARPWRELDDIDERALRSSIEAAGSDLWVANMPSTFRRTVVVPLLDDATLRRANEKNEKLPFYPAPE